MSNKQPTINSGDGVPGGSSICSLPILCACILLIGFITIPANPFRGDPLTVQVVTVGLINNGTIKVSEENALVAGEKGQYYYQNIRTGDWYSKYGEMNTIMYVPPLAFEKIFRGTLDYNWKSRLRVLTLGVYSIFLSLIICCYIWLLASLYSSNRLLRFCYVVSIFYATFAWFYLRGSSFEIFQMLFFTGFTYHCFSFRRITGPAAQVSGWSPRAHLFAASLFLGMLCLAKLIFLLLVPLFIAFAVLASISTPVSARSVWASIQSNFRTCFLYLLLPIILFCVIILALNTHKFGSPFDTGYRQWANNRELFSGPLLDGISGYLFSPQRSLFIHFPVLLISLIGIPMFWRKHRYELLFLVSSFLIFLAVNAKFCDWAGSWGYGPRYLLFILPVLSLPALYAPAAIWLMPLRVRVTAVTLAVILLIYSSVQQVAVNSFDFFVCEDLKFIFNSLTVDQDSKLQINKYLKKRPYGHICLNLMLYKAAGRQFPLVEGLRGKCDPGQLQLLEGALEAGYSFDWNYYWLQAYGLADQRR